MNQINENSWFCICKPLKKINSGEYIFFSDELNAQVLNKNENGLILKFKFQGNFLIIYMMLELCLFPPISVK